MKQQFIIVTPEGVFSKPEIGGTVDATHTNAKK